MSNKTVLSGSTHGDLIFSLSRVICVAGTIWSLHCNLMNESENRAPLFVFTGIIVLSILFFFLLTSGGDKKTTARGDEAGENQGSASVTPPATGGVMPPDGRLSIPVEMDLDGRKSAPELPIIDGVPLTGIPAPIRAFVSDTLDGTLESTFSAAINAIPQVNRNS